MHIYLYYYYNSILTTSHYLFMAIFFVVVFVSKFHNPFYIKTYKLKKILESLTHLKIGINWSSYLHNKIKNQFQQFILQRKL